MYAIAAQVRFWLGDGRAVHVAHVVASRGFSSRDHAAALAWTDDGRTVGELLDGALAAPIDGEGLVDVTITDASAESVGLSCGGVATVSVLLATAYPAELWDRLVDRQPVCVVADAAAAQLFTAATIRDAHEFGADLPRLFGRGTSLTAVVEQDGTRRAVVCLWPVPNLVVVGDGLIATALLDTAALVGWRASATNNVDEAVAVLGSLERSDAVVVLSHDRPVDGPSLAAALAGRAGYVGALGSRRTQALRREWLTEHDVATADQDRIHGPAGLDIDAHTPAEIAISIVAEILAGRAGGAVGGALRDRTGPVHVAGVQAPPPRYEPGTPRRQVGG